MPDKDQASPAAEFDRFLAAHPDIAYVDGRVIVAGLSNEEFSSSLRAIPFPFSKVDRGTLIENYHGAHGQFETRAPVRTLIPFRVGGQDQILAAYTCTPLVQFALSDLKPGAKIMGKTIAEFGNGNRPLDIILYQKDGKDYLLMANSSRGVIKVATGQIAAAESITARVAGTGRGRIGWLHRKGLRVVRGRRRHVRRALPPRAVDGRTVHFRSDAWQGQTTFRWTRRRAAGSRTASPWPRWPCWC